MCTQHQNAQHKHTAQSESVLCQGEERETHTKKGEEERKSKSNHASGQGQIRVIKRCGWLHFNIKIPKHFEMNGRLVIFNVSFPLFISLIFSSFLTSEKVNQSMS